MDDSALGADLTNSNHYAHLCLAEATDVIPTCFFFSSQLVLPIANLNVGAADLSVRLAKEGERRGGGAGVHEVLRPLSESSCVLCFFRRNHSQRCEFMCV